MGVSSNFIARTKELRATMPPKKKPATPKLPTPVDSVALKHTDKRTNIPTEELCGFGRWAFLKIVDPWDAKNTIRAFIQGKQADGIAPMFREK
jgi:hypothetical protein